MNTLFQPRTLVDLLTHDIVSYWDREYETAPTHMMDSAVAEWLFRNGFDDIHVIEPVIRDSVVWVMLEDYVRSAAFKYGVPEVNQLSEIPEHIRVEVYLFALHQLLWYRLERERGDGYEIDALLTFEVSESAIDLLSIQAE